MANRTQTHRHARLGTPLGKDALLFKSMTGGERLGRPFQYNLVLLSENKEIPYQAIIGQNISLDVDQKGSEPRFFNGFVSRFQQIQFEGDLVEYRAEVVPWLWFLTRSSDCRIFQEMTVPEIVIQVFKDHGFTDVSDRLRGQYPKCEFCVQYRETAFNFVSRLMEQEGIYYYFKHESGKHTIVLCDSIGSHLPFAGYEELVYRPRSKGQSVNETVWNWTASRQIQPGGYVLNDFDWEKPSKRLLRNHVIDPSHAGGSWELYDYPGEFKEPDEAERYSKLRLEELHAQHETFKGEGDPRGICTGVRFKLKAHPCKAFEKEYLTTGVDYRIQSNEFESHPASTPDFAFETSLTAIDSAVPFRTPSATPRPEIKGPQTAIVVGSKGEEIFTDKYGRVKVQFHWDRHGKADENASCWIRVAQIWAGKKWGAMQIPRVGQEVIVEFLEGDPDRPIITGRVYNGASMPPYELPANKTISTQKSNSSKGGNGFNEIRFDDKKGSEQLFIHGEKDQDIRIKNDTREWIGHESHLIIKKDQLELVEADKHTTVKGDQLSKIEGDQSEKIVGAHLAAIDGNDHLTVKGDQAAKIDGDIHLKGAKNLNTDVGQTLSIKTGKDLHSKASMNMALESGMEIHIKGGMKVIIEGGMQVSLKAGPSFVDLGPSGVSISGPMVLINSGGAAGSGSGCKPQAPKAPEAPAAPKEPKEAATADPGEKDEPIAAPEPPTPVTYSASAKVLQEAAQNGTPFCDK